MIKLSKFFIPYIFFLIVLGFKGEIIIAFILVFIHEIAHYLAARKLGFSGFDVKFLPIGTVLNLKDLDEASAEEDFIISLAGPLLNFILALLFYVLFVCYKNNYFYLIFSSNLALGIFNLIPAFPLDGGRIVRDILCRRFIYKKANEITLKISIGIGIFFMIIYFVIIIKGKRNITFGIIALFIIVTSLKEKERIAYLIMGDIIKKRYKFIKRGYIENKSISIYYKEDLLTAIGLVDRNKYNVFMVLDDNMNVIYTMYEGEVIDGLREYGNITLKEFFYEKHGRG